MLQLEFAAKPDPRSYVGVGEPRRLECPSRAHPVRGIERPAGQALIN
jgi:hypothetical protein